MTKTKSTPYYRIQYQLSDHPVGPRHRSRHAVERYRERALRAAVKGGDHQGIRIVEVSA